eukprot:GHVN01010340.1.p2 GENE.GHVN01010340.1~~GHVN01010340.1.p2  ORF type:complete len:186 (+),score=22.69 GHVN01010340.1:164-721(+)
MAEGTTPITDPTPDPTPVAPRQMADIVKAFKDEVDAYDGDALLSLFPPSLRDPPAIYLRICAYFPLLALPTELDGISAAVLSARNQEAFSAGVKGHRRAALMALIALLKQKKVEGRALSPKMEAMIADDGPFPRAFLMQLWALLRKDRTASISWGKDGEVRKLDVPPEIAASRLHVAWAKAAWPS